MVYVYIAGPYSGDHARNVAIALSFADRVLKLGHVPYVPHLSYLWDEISPKPYEDWIALGLAWVERCDVVLRLPGESPGANREVAYAQALGKPVAFGIADFEAWLEYKKL